MFPKSKLLQKLYHPELALLLSIILLASCGANDIQQRSANASFSTNSPEFDSTISGGDINYMLQIPEIEQLDDRSGPIKVIATTSIIGDVVFQIGGNNVDLTTLMEPGQDPHSFISSVSDLRNVAESDVIFVGGWGLEEGLIDDLSSVSESPQIPVSAGIEPRFYTSADENADGEMKLINPDPHTWLDPHLVVKWVDNIRITLSELDPANADSYRLNADTYKKQLNQIIDLYNVTVDSIEPSKRKLITNHDSLGYFADAYDFEVIGSLLPSGSTLAEPSARGLAEIVRLMKEASICTIFTENTSNSKLAIAVANELDDCPEVFTADLYTGSLGPEGSGAETYLKMMAKNIEKIEQGVQ